MAFSFYEQHIHEDPDFPIIFHNDNLMEDSNFLSHWHENIEFLYFRQGRGVVLCDAVPYTALPGDAVIINTGALHTISRKLLSAIMTVLLSTSFSRRL